MADTCPVHGHRQLMDDDHFARPYAAYDAPKGFPDPPSGSCAPASRTSNSPPPGSR